MPTASTEICWPRDANRIVPVPLGDALIIDAPDLETRVEFADDGSTTRPDGARVNVGGHRGRGFARFFSDGREIGHCEFLLLGDWTPAGDCQAARPVAPDTHAVLTNGRGAMAQVRGRWASIDSQYDCLLAANLDPEQPTDRRVVVSRCRLWANGEEMNGDSVAKFRRGADGVFWEFDSPKFQVSLAMPRGANAVRLTFHGGDHAVDVRACPDLEDRSFHQTTQAFTGPEQAIPAAIAPHPAGFDFRLGSGENTTFRLEGARFEPAPNWTYMVPLPFEAGRGLAAATDVFCPGAFEFRLAPGETRVLQIAIGETLPTPAPAASPTPLQRPMADFLVARGDTLSVIAGYPWFLDWGRDTMIFLRGMIAAGLHEDSLSILQTFARFEDGGTLPNMIRGGDASDRDTSDAPLWFVVACNDLVEASGAGVLKTDCGGRSLGDVVRSIVLGYLRGTANGIAVNEQTGLVFSPAHFTWMDTDNPAGTPREGYPIEIQALWFAALKFLARIDPAGSWRARSEQVRESVMTHFWRADLGFLSDCLHTRAAIADDHLRPNQLFAITLGLIDDPQISRQIVTACAELVVPGAIRSLSARPVTHPLPVTHDGQLLNAPENPYWGHYEGDENTRRKPAYHNGTAWTWPFPSYAEALLIAGGEPARARSLLSSAADLLSKGCLGQLPEVADGNAPHTQRGCGAQAWSASELSRVAQLLGAAN